MQYQRACVFCGSKAKLTKQHIFPNWMRQFVAKNKDHHKIRTVRSNLPMENRIVVERFQTIKQGRLISRTLQIVCAKCNNEWMSQVENDTKPIIERICKGKETILSIGMRKLLACQVSLILCMQEQADRVSGVITAEERLYIKKFRVPPEDWIILVGLAEDEWWSSRSTKVSLSLAPRDPLSIPRRLDISPGRRNVHISTFGLGRAIFQNYITSLPNVRNSFDLSISHDKLVQVWPIRRRLGVFPRRSEKFPPAHILAREEIDDLSLAQHTKLLVLTSGTQDPCRVAAVVERLAPGLSAAHQQTHGPRA